MRKRYKITTENALEARKYMKEVTDKKIYRRLEVIALRGEGLKNAEIAKVTKFSTRHITQLVSLFSSEGFEPLLTDKRGGNHRKVSLEEEQKFLKKYEEKAISGEIITVNQMRQDFSTTFGVEMCRSGFYFFLARHNWRKVKLRSVHPKVADASEIEASKKLKQVTEMQ